MTEQFERLMPMFSTNHSQHLLLMIALSVFGCGDDDGNEVEQMMTGGMLSGGMMSPGDAATGGASTPGDGGANSACSAQVEIGFYADPECTQPVMAASSTRIYDTRQECFSWEGGSAAGENSVTRFQCFRDRLCYTQHPATLACNNGSPTNKEARTDECVLDTQTPDGSRAIYAKIIGGTESCPEAPADFECPVSELQAGTPGIAACTTVP